MKCPKFSELAKKIGLNKEGASRCCRKNCITYEEYLATILKRGGKG